MRAPTSCIPWVKLVAITGAVPSLAARQLCDIAAEEDPAGPLATIDSLLEGLIQRHAEDPATLAALIAIEQLHLPNLVASLSEGA